MFDAVESFIVFNVITTCRGGLVERDMWLSAGYDRASIQQDYDKQLAHLADIASGTKDFSVAVMDINEQGLTITNN